MSNVIVSYNACNALNGLPGDKFSLQGSVRYPEKVDFVERIMVGLAAGFAADKFFVSFYLRALKC